MSTLQHLTPRCGRWSYFECLLTQYYPTISFSNLHANFELYVYRSGDYKLIVGNPGRYNNWYKAKTKPACNSREARQGYMYEERRLKQDEKLDRQEQKSMKGWWFTSPLKYIQG